MIPEARQLLLDTAARLLAEHGIERINTNRIAREAGVGVGTFYSQFPDKHDLHRALILHAVEELSKHLARAPGAGDLAGEVRAWVDGVVSFGEEHPQLFTAAFGREPRPAPGVPAVGLSIRPVERRLEGLRKAGQLDPAVDPAIAARGYAAMLTSLVCWWLGDPARADRSGLVDTLVRLHPALAARVAS